MADSILSDLPVADAIVGDELVLVTQAGASKQTTVATLGGGSSATLDGVLSTNFGDIPKGTDVTGLSPAEAITQGFIGEIVVVANLTAPSSLTLEKGDTKTNVTMSYSLVIGTSAVTKVEYLTNGGVIETVNTPPSTGSFVVPSVANTTFSTFGPPNKPV